MTRPCDHHGSASKTRCDRCGVFIGAAGEASGLIDVRALAAMMGTAARTDPPALRLTALTAAPVAIAPTPAPARTVAAVAPAPTPLYFMLGALALGMMALATFIVSRPAPVVVHRPAPVMAVAQAPERVEAPVEEDRPEPAEVAVAAVEPVAAEPAEAVEEAPPAPTKGGRKSPRKPPASAPATTGTQPDPTPAVAAGPAADSVKCLLEPELCKAKAAPKPAPVASPPVSSNSLPDKLEPADISEGTRAAKAAAIERCRGLARGGEKVTIKLSIAGPEGAVMSASPQDDAGNPKLGACCAAELARSTFKKVQKAQIGALATLKF